MKTIKPLHIIYVADEYSRRIQINPHYSLRAYARDLEVTASWLSEFMREKKGISISTAERITQSLNFSATESRLFILSAQAHHSRSLKSRQQAQKELKNFIKSDFFKMHPKDFSLTGSWYHQAILELTELQDFKHDEKDIADRLCLPLTTVQQAIAQLKAAKLLEIVNGKMQSCISETESTVDVSSIAIRKYHEQIINKSLLALHEQSVQKREYTSVTFAFDSSRILEAKKALRKFQKQFMDEFYVESNSKDSVYQLSFQLFRLDKKR